MNKFICGLILLLSSTFASAGCYLGVGSGKSNLTKIKTSKNEELFASEYVDGSYTTNGIGHSRNLLLGCTASHDTAFELGYTSGIDASIDNEGRITFPKLGDRSVPFSVSQHASAKMYTLSAIKFFEIRKPVSVFGRLGVVHTSARYDVDVPLGDGFSLHKDQSKTMNSPYVGLGIAFRSGGHLSLRVEHRVFARQLSDNAVTLIYRF